MIICNHVILYSLNYLLAIKLKLIWQDKKLWVLEVFIVCYVLPILKILIINYESLSFQASLQYLFSKSQACEADHNTRSGCWTFNSLSYNLKLHHNYILQRRIQRGSTIFVRTPLFTRLQLQRPLISIRLISMIYYGITLFIPCLSCADSRY